MRTRIVMEEHYTRCQHSTPFVLNGHMQFFLVFRNTHTHVFSVKRADNSTNFAAGMIINGRTHYKSLTWRQEKTIGDLLCDGLQGNESCDTTSHAQALPCRLLETSSLKEGAM
jgi:hypothetical protein